MSVSDWVILGICVAVGLVVAAKSAAHKTSTKMDMNRRSNSKILKDYDAEQNFVDKYSR